MADFIELIKKDSKVQKETSQTIEKQNKESYSTQSKSGQNAFVQTKAFEQPTKLMEDTVADKDMEIEQNYCKREYLENKIILLASEVIEEINKPRLNKMSYKKNGIGLWID